VDLDFFLGKTLIQVCIGANDCNLNFDDGLRISVTSVIGCVESNNVYRKYEDFRQAAPNLVALLDRVVMSAREVTGGTLSIEFRGGGRLDIYDDSKEYESYVIRHKDKQIVV